MRSKLNHPIGQDKKPTTKHKVKKSARWQKLAGLTLVSVLFLAAGYVALVQEPFQQDNRSKPDTEIIGQGAQPVLDNKTAELSDNTAKLDKADKNSEQAAIGIIDKQSGLSGAQIKSITTPEGVNVTTISPQTRTDKGHLILETPGLKGQNARIAHLPDPAIFEKTSFGRLPIYGQNGKRAVDIYARPWSGARGVRIAIVVGGLGLSQTGSHYAINKLPKDITLGFAANGNSLQRWMQAARQGGHEILLQIPFEPFDYPDNNPGRGTLIVKNDPQSNLNALHQGMGRITNYTGIGNFMGGRFLSDAQALEPIMRDIAKRGIMFFDDGTSARSLTEAFSETLGIPFAAGDIILDNKVAKGQILKKLDDLERIARRNGQAIGVASGFRDSVDAIAAWSNEAKARGIEFVGISALANDPERR